MDNNQTLTKPLYISAVDLKIHNSLNKYLKLNGQSKTFFVQQAILEKLKRDSKK